MGRSRIVSAGSLRVTGALFATCSSAFAPLAAAKCSAVRRKRAITSSRTPMSNVRSVPIMVAVSGMMLKRVPLLSWPAVRTTGVAVMSTWRATIDCVPSSTCAATVIGSTPAHGCEPWVCLPVTVSVHSSALAMNGPARTPIRPTLSRDHTCSPSTASGLNASNTPSSSIFFAPNTWPATGGPSSAGWNTNITSPGSVSRRAASASATPIRIATCRSWPQACITPTAWPRPV